VNCTDFLAKLTDYFDGQIDPALLAEVKEHLGSCHHCEVVVDSTRKTIDVYRGTEVYELPEDLAGKMRAAVMERCRKIGKLPDLEKTGPTHTAEEALRDYDPATNTFRQSEKV
jgi:anti-sigma factor RsiW